MLYMLVIPISQIRETEAQEADLTFICTIFFSLSFFFFLDSTCKHCSEAASGTGPLPLSPWLREIIFFCPKVRPTSSFLTLEQGSSASA